MYNDYLDPQRDMSYNHNVQHNWLIRSDVHFVVIIYKI